MKKELIIVIISLVLFILILANISNLSFIDNSVNSYISTIQNPLLIQISEIIGQIFEPINIIVFSLIIALILFLKGFRRDSSLFVGAMFAGGTLEYLLKFLVGRARPDNALITESLNSFPSGHALISMIMFGFFIYFISKNVKSKSLKILTTIASVILILVIGASRSYLNVHWSSDVLGGWLLGLAILFGSISFVKK